MIVDRKVPGSGSRYSVSFYGFVFIKGRFERKELLIISPRLRIGFRGKRESKSEGVWSSDGAVETEGLEVRNKGEVLERLRGFTIPDVKRREQARVYSKKGRYSEKVEGVFV